jgi:hypothetical protein
MDNVRLGIAGIPFCCGSLARFVLPRRGTFTGSRLAPSIRPRASREPACRAAFWPCRLPLSNALSGATLANLSNIVGGAVTGGVIGLVVYLLASPRRQGEKIDPASTTTAQPPPNKSMVGPIAGIATIALLWFAIQLVVSAFMLLLIYGVVIIIFRLAFGIELPHPF